MYTYRVNVFYFYISPIYTESRENNLFPPFFLHVNNISIVTNLSNSYSHMHTKKYKPPK